MNRDKRVEIWATDENGERGRLNEFRGDNDAILSMSAEGQASARARLLTHALRCQAAWRSVLPNDKVEVIS